MRFVDATHLSARKIILVNSFTDVTRRLKFRHNYRRWIKRPKTNSMCEKNALKLRTDPAACLSSPALIWLPFQWAGITNICSGTSAFVCRWKIWLLFVQHCNAMPSVSFVQNMEYVIKRVFCVSFSLFRFPSLSRFSCYHIYGILENLLSFFVFCFCSLTLYRFFFNIH